uniref:Sec1 family domain-containing protein 1 n=1 Tax=Bursaphelenchus xylophilus TaxID=6326 RepID=A0A1I7SVH2_BURXY
MDRNAADSLRSRQIAAVKQILNLNAPLSHSLAVEPVWKVLILDKYGSDIISPLIPVKNLRELGVTLHLTINSRRDSLPDVPAVYFVSPTDENIAIISDDLQKAMYDSFYLNMIWPIQRPQLEDLATAAVAGQVTPMVQKLVDQYLNYISLEDGLFSLRRYTKDSPFSFYAINNTSISPEEMDFLLDQVASSLFSVCVSLGVVPIIKCPKGNAAEEVAKRLDQKIRDNLRDARNNLFTNDNVRAGQFSLHRPVLVIADRSLDLPTMLHHTWTYQAMIHDVLDYDLNRIKMTDSQQRKKEYDVSSTDKLWFNFKGSPFPEVAEAIQSDLDAYRKNEEEIKKLKTSMGIQNAEDEAAVMLLDDATSKLQTAMGSLPELLEQKRLIDQHTNVATSLLENIKQRQLDVLFETEEKLLNGQYQEVNISEVFKALPNTVDALRLLLIAYLCNPNVTENEKREFKELLQQREIDQSALKFVECIKRATSLQLGTSDLHSGGGTKTLNMFGKLLSHSSRFVMEGVKNLVPKKHNLPVTKVRVWDFLNFCTVRTGFSTEK